MNYTNTQYTDTKSLNARFQIRGIQENIHTRENNSLDKCPHILGQPFPKTYDFTKQINQRCSTLDRDQGTRP